MSKRGPAVDDSRISIAASRSTNRLRAEPCDLLPVLYFLSLLLTGHWSLSVYALWLALGDSTTEIDEGLIPLVWIVSSIAPFILYERRFAERLSPESRSKAGMGFGTRLLILLAVIWSISYSGRWLEQMVWTWTLLWLAGGLTASAIGRQAVRWHLLRHLASAEGRPESTAVIGSGELADRLAMELGTRSALFGHFEEQTSGDGPASQLETGLQRLMAMATLRKPERILVAPARIDPIGLQAIIDRLRPLQVPIELRTAARSAAVSPVIRLVGGRLPVALLADQPIRRWSGVFKTGKDLLIGISLTLVLSPLLLLIALAIKLDSPGPVLFRQRRHGFNNREFDIYKFRTMRCVPLSLGSVLEQTVRGDPRITRIGHFLRKWSLDELPQVFNVLEGNMSLVGPRPHAINMRTEQRLGQEITDAYCHRHRVKPGITGWSQINGSRGATDTVEQLRRRIELDLYYVDHWSLLFDLKILVLTAREVLRTTNAY